MKKIVLSILLLSMGCLGYELDIKNGWQLKGSLEDMTVDFFDYDCVDTVWSYTANSWMAYSPRLELQTALQKAQIEPLQSIKKANGFWIKANQDCYLSSFVSEKSLKLYTFDSNISGWFSSYGGACEIVLQDKSLLVTNRAHHYDGAFIDITDVLQADTLYIIRVFIKTDTNDSYSLNAKISYGTPVYKQLSRIKIDDNSSNRIKAFVTFSQDEIDAGVSLFVNSDTTKGDYALDDAEIATTNYDNTKDTSDEILFIKDGAIVDKDDNNIIIRGINVIAYNDDQSEEYTDFWNYSYFNVDKNDFVKIKSLGFNAIRLSLWYKYFEDDETLEYRDIGFAWLDTMIAWAKEAGVYVLLDMHAPQGGGFQGPSSNNDFWSDTLYQTRFVDLWKEIATRYKNESTVLGYDLLNEPSPPTEQAYRDLLAQTIEAIRAIDTNHIINVEVSFAVNGEGAAEPFELEYENILYDFHFYDPWDDFTDDEQSIYGVDVTKQQLVALFKDFSDFYISKNLAYNVSEFGQKYSDFIQKNSKQWVDDVMSTMSENGIDAYFYFSYKGNEFGLYELQNKYSDSLKINEELVDVFEKHQ